MAKKYWEKPITLRLTAYQRKTLSQIVDGALDAGACKGGLTKLESNALTSVFMRLIGAGEPSASAACSKCAGEGFINRHANLPDEPCPACSLPSTPRGGET